MKVPSCHTEGGGWNRAVGCPAGLRHVGRATGEQEEDVFSSPSHPRHKHWACASQTSGETNLYHLGATEERKLSWTPTDLECHKKNSKGSRKPQLSCTEVAPNGCASGCLPDPTSSVKAAITFPSFKLFQQLPFMLSCFKSSHITNSLQSQVSRAGAARGKGLWACLSPAETRTKAWVPTEEMHAVLKG